jgi:hypothetical protein
VDFVFDTRDQEVRNMIVHALFIFPHDIVQSTTIKVIVQGCAV